jgi:RNA polymerase sigma factor (sigma-70 family)
MTPIFRARRTTAFDRLYRQHVASVYRYAHAVLGNRADAEDVTQQTFLNAYRAWAQGTKPRKAENWLLTIAHNEVRRHFRKASGRSLEVEYDDQVGQPAPERVEPSVADVLRALQHLPATQREALVMREFEGRSYAEIAEILDVTQSALEALIFRARRSLAEQLGEGLTCAEAEQAVSRRLDGRLRRRDARALRRHLRECPACTRFEQVQKEQRSLLGGLAVMPVPASLYLLKGESAAAALGISTGAAAGGVGGSVAGAGVAGVATGVAAKAVAVTAVVAVAGGVGYGVATEAQTLARADRPEARTTAAVPKQERRRKVLLAATHVRPRATLVSPIGTSTPRSADAATKKATRAKPKRESKAKARGKSGQRSEAADSLKTKAEQKTKAHRIAKANAKAAKARVAKARPKPAPRKSTKPAKAKAKTNSRSKAKTAATPKTKTKAKADAQPKTRAESNPERATHPEPAAKKPEPAAGPVAPPDAESGPDDLKKKDAGV